MSEEFNIWIKTLECNSNNTKSSGLMETAGATEVFNRSITKQNFIYNEYLGDGDNSSHKEVVY